MIVICGLNDKQNLELGKLLSDRLDMFLLVLKDMLEYEIVSNDEVIEKAGIQYLNKLEKAAIKRAASFENTVLVADYNNFVINNNFEAFKQKAVIVFLNNSKANLEEKSLGIDVLNLLNFEVRNKELLKISDIVVEAKNSEEKILCEQIIEKLKEVLLWI